MVTGANGFIGQALIKSLCQTEYHVRATVRSASALASLSDYQKQWSLKNLSIYNLGELSDTTDWSDVLTQVDTVIHCAARAHILRETNTDPLQIFRQMNTQVTAHLAQQASALGVRRFIFLSSIGVLGRISHMTPFTDESQPNPQVPYAQAKWEAEQLLCALPGNMDRVIIRSPLVYGPGVKGNFGVLLNLISKRIPLPFGAVKNRRQFIGIDNLVDFMMVCISQNAFINETFLIADKEVLSTTQLLRYLSEAMGKPMILLPVPHAWLKWVLHALGKSVLAEQLLGNLEINSDKAWNLLGWKAPYTMKEQLLFIRNK